MTEQPAFTFRPPVGIGRQATPTHEQIETSRAEPVGTVLCLTAKVLCWHARVCCDLLQIGVWYLCPCRPHWCRLDWGVFCSWSCWNQRYNTIKNVLDWHVTFGWVFSVTFRYKSMFMCTQFPIHEYLGDQRLLKETSYNKTMCPFEQSSLWISLSALLRYHWNV